MSRILTVFLFLFLAFTIYYDLITGSLPLKPTPIDSKHANISTPAQEKIKFVSVRVQAGDTVLSIHEHLSSNTEKSISIAQLIQDFETLNPSTTASKIKIGMVYKFPVYPPSTEQDKNQIE